MPTTVIAAFDFDKTLISKDSFLDFIIFVHGLSKSMALSLRALPILLRYWFGKLPADQAKEGIFSLYFKSMPAARFSELAGAYAKERLPKIVNLKAVRAVEDHRKQGHRLIIVSASMREWIAPWADVMGFEAVIATEAEIAAGTLTGKFATPNCNGSEKARRVLAAYPKRSEYLLYAYGDSQKDWHLLALADYPFLNFQKQ